MNLVSKLFTVRLFVVNCRVYEQQKENKVGNISPSTLDFTLFCAYENYIVHNFDVRISHTDLP